MHQTAGATAQRPEVPNKGSLWPGRKTRRENRMRNQKNGSEWKVEMSIDERAERRAIARSSSARLRLKKEVIRGPAAKDIGIMPVD